MPASAPVATVAGTVHEVAAAFARGLSNLSVLDWILVALAAYVVWWGWARAAAFVRLGPIEIADPATDESALDPSTAKAHLQEQLAKRGELPPSGVPNGSPTVAGVAAAITAAPLPQANWLGVLIGLLPTPPTSTGFQLGVTLLQDTSGPESYGLIYKLVCSRPRPSVTIDHVWAGDQATLFDDASKTIFLKIGAAAPDIYPRWARWDGLPALSAYREGIDRERHPERFASELGTDTDRYDTALPHYREASALDPDNMLARLRLANCLERRASGIDDESKRTQMEALLEYMTIRARQPTIFEAGYRASVLLIGLAEHAHAIDPDQKRVLRELLGRTRIRDRETAGLVARWLTWRRRRWSRGTAPDILNDEHFVRAARHESALARLRLLPFWTMVSEGRFRHRFEPSGQERRHLRKALGVSYWAIRARLAGRAPERGRAEASQLVQYVWNAWVFWRYMAGRSRIAGWQAHYNAACFYALLPLADHPRADRPGKRIRRRALRHLARAIDQAPDGAISFVYLRDEDPDLGVLRRRSREEFERIARRLRPDEFTLRYRRGVTDGPWRLYVSGGGGEPTAVMPITTTDAGAIYRVKVVDETKPLCMSAHRGHEVLETWTVVLAEYDSSQAWVFPGDQRVYRDKHQATAYPA